MERYLVFNEMLNGEVLAMKGMPDWPVILLSHKSCGLCYYKKQAAARLFGLCN